MEKRSLPLSNALEICEKEFQEYKERVVENTKKEENTLFYDPKSGRYFHCSFENVAKAEKKLNEKLETNNVYLNDFYDEINVERTYPGALFGWLKGSKIHIDIGLIADAANKEIIYVINIDENISVDEMEEKWPYLSDEERLRIFKKYIGLEV